MDQQYNDFRQQFSASSSPDSGSRLSSIVGVLGPRSQAYGNQPQQSNSTRGYRRCGTCDQEPCYCAAFYEQAARYETSDVQMSGSGPSINTDYTRYEAENFASQTAGDGLEAGSYDMTERQAGYRQDFNEAVVQSELLQQYSNTETGSHLPPATPWTTREGSSSGPPGFNTSADQSNTTTIQENQRMFGHGNDIEDDDDENKIIHGSEEKEPGKQLSVFEAFYQPGLCHLKGCKKGHIFETFQSYRSHIKNVHTKALWCKVSTCPHPRPFANQSDLNRHDQAKHGDKSDKPHKCLRADCAARVKAFKRKDKLREHNTNYHAECCCFFCPRRRWFETFEACAEHTNRRHIHVTGD